MGVKRDAVSGVRVPRSGLFQPRDIANHKTCLILQFMNATARHERGARGAGTVCPKVLSNYMAASNLLIAMKSKAYCVIYLVDEVPGLHDEEDFKGFLSPTNPRPHARTVDDTMLEFMFTEWKCFFFDNN